MAQAEKKIHIEAPVERVFDTVAHIESFSQAVPHIEDVEFLSDQHSGVGARFRETRVINGREATTELEVTEYEKDRMVRIVSDAGGTVWDTLFTTRPSNGGTDLEMAMEARPHKLIARIVTPFIMGMVSKAVGADLEAVKGYCES